MDDYISREEVLKLLEVEERCGYLDAGDITSVPAIDAYPCTFCAYNPPSCKDGKPCCYCPATAKREEVE